MVNVEFMKWWDKECANSRVVYPSSYDDCSDAWKAAITWALEGFNSDIHKAIVQEGCEEAKKEPNCNNYKE